MSTSIRDLEFKIEDIFQKGGDRFKISQEIKSFITEYKIELKSSFLEDNKGKQFVLKYTRFYDSVISLIYKTVLRSMFGNYLPMKNSIPIVVVALGSYGREEMTLHSDIDLMVAYVNVEGYNVEKIIEQFIYMAWDSGLKLGHRVHAIPEIKSVAESDETIKTALIESRKIIGSSFVWGVLEDQLNMVRDHNRVNFLTQKIKDRDVDNHALYGFMEPDLKDGKGGLRDANTLFWILNIIYRVNSIKDLSGELFNDSEYKSFLSALDYIFSVRTALHLSLKKKRDRVVLDDVPILSKMLSMNSHVHFSQKLLYSMWIVHSFSMKISQKALKYIEFNRFSIREIREARVSKNIFLKSKELQISSNLRFKNLNNFIKALLSIPDEKFKNGITTFSLVDNIGLDGEISRRDFIRLFQRKEIYPIIELLFISSTLEKILKPFDKVMFYPQFDGYHKHSVELHSINTLKEVENIEVDPFKSIYDELPKSELFILKIASLFHDIGKGRVEDHRKVGARVIKSFLRDFNIDEEIVERVSLLIRHHTLMTDIAYHEDIYSENVILSFTSKLKEERNLKLLYLLTYADVKSVSETALNSYSRNLLKELYNNAISSFSNEELLKESEKREKRERQISNSERYRNLPRSLQRNIMKIGSNLAFFKLSNDEIINIVEWIKGVQHFDYQLNNNDFFSLKVVRNFGENFDIAYLLNRVNFLSVISLDVFDLFNGAKYFQIDFSEKLDEGDIRHIDRIIKEAFSSKKKMFSKITPKIGRDEVEIDYNYSNSYAKISLHTFNQNGLLAYLFKLFEDDGIDIVSSKTQTFKKRVKDTFLFKKGRDSSEENYIKLVNKIIGEV